MKRVITVILILSFTVLLFSKPIIKFDSLEHDFGDIKEDGGPYEYEFIFSNTGDEPLKLIKVKAS
jgi:hypothetical protein